MRLGRQIRHIGRFREIAAVLARHGFGFVIEETELFHALSLPARMFRKKGKMQRRTVGERLRSAFQDLGPTFVKIGQLASTRADVLPAEIAEELAKLQDDVAPFPFEAAEETIAAELGRPLDELFEAFERIPAAAASIGQVHIARLPNGEKVAVKVQRPGIAATIRTDLDILLRLAALAENRFEWARTHQLRMLAAELARSLLEELDYRTEGRNAEAIRRQFAGSPTVRIPAVYWDYTSKRVLVMEYISGVPVNRMERLREWNISPKMLSERILCALFHQMFVEGVFHADPHPGNLLALADGSIAFLDFGMVGRLSPEMKRGLADLIIALMRQSTDGIMKAAMRLKLVSEEVDAEALRRDVVMLRDKYYGVPLSSVSLSEAVLDLLSAARRHHIRIPPDFALLGKALLTAEGVVVALDPDISIMNVAEPFGLRLLAERLHPMRMAEEAWRRAAEFAAVMVRLPKQASDVMKLVRTGRVRAEIGLKDLEPMMKQLDRIGNRLSFSIVMLSFSIVMSGVIIGSALGGRQTVLPHVPAVEIGFIIAMIMLLWLLAAIFRSRRF